MLTGEKGILKEKGGVSLEQFCSLTAKNLAGKRIREFKGRKKGGKNGGRRECSGKESLHQVKKRFRLQKPVSGGGKRNFPFN